MLNKKTSYTVFYNYYKSENKGHGAGYLTHIIVVRKWWEKLDINSLNSFIQKQVIKINEDMSEGDIVIITNLIKE